MIAAQWLERLVWAGGGCLLALVIALSVGRIHALHPLVKVWVCRLACLKAMFALAWSFTVPVYASSATGWSVPVWMVLYLLAFWIVGFGLVMKSLFEAHLLARRLRRISSATHEAEVEGAAKVIEARGFETRSIAGLSEACVAGLWRPCLYLPVDTESDAGVVAHELAHLRHRDLQWNAVTWVAYAVFWFVPGFGRLMKERALWQEGAADLVARRALSVTPEAQAATLIRVLSGPRFTSPAVMAFAGDAPSVDRRIRAMYRSRYPAPLALLVALVVLAVSVPMQLERRAASPKGIYRTGPLLAPRVPIAAAARIG